jgi:hypothetical protein
MTSEIQKRPVRPKPESDAWAPFLWIDWTCQWIAYWAGSLAVFRVLEYAGKLTVLIALITWIADYPERQQAAIRTVWSVVDAKGGGRKEALQYLANHKVDLNGLYGEAGYFAGIVLRDSDLRWANLTHANFENADLSGANFQGSSLQGTNFENANLVKARFGGAFISDNALTKFKGARIEGADFRGAQIMYTSSGLSASPRIIRELAAADGWRNANFDDNIGRAIGCAADPGQDICQ